MTGSGYTTQAPPVSMCCAPWRTIDEHDRCHGTVLLGNLGPLVPCGCTRPDCANNARHRCARELYAGAAR